MTSIQITLPESANRFIEEQIATGKYESPSDVLVDLVEKARIHAAKEKLAELIREGMESGEGAEVTDEYWERLTQNLKQNLSESGQHEAQACHAATGRVGSYPTLHLFGGASTAQLSKASRSGAHGHCRY